MSDKSQQTEKATPKRLQKAREEGQFPVAKEFVGSMQLMGGLMALSAWGAFWFANMRWQFRSGLVQSFQLELGQAGFLLLVRQTLFHAFWPVMLGGAVLMAVTLFVQLITTGLGVSGKKLMPNFKNFNPMSRLKGLPKQNAAAVVQSLLLLVVVGMVVYRLLEENFLVFLAMPVASLSAGTAQLSEAISTMLWKVAGVMLVFGVVDLFRQRLKFNKDLRMSKQEIRDEHKESEGNPQIKGHIKRLRRNILRKQMMREVPSATALIVNPTHFAVAIRYDVDTMASPKVVAKGKNYLAARIKQKALENGVPIVENPPLARALYKAVEPGQEIPANFYRAVAEVLAYIFKLTNSRNGVTRR